MVTDRPRIAATWLVALLAAVVVLTLYLMHPRGGLRERMMAVARPSDLSTAYLETWLRARPDETDLLPILGAQYSSIGRFDDARRIAGRIDALGTDAMHRVAQLLRLEADAHDAVMLKETDARRAPLLSQLRARLALADVGPWSTSDLEVLARTAGEANAPDVAKRFYARLVKQDVPNQVRWLREMVRFAGYAGDQRTAARGWFTLKSLASTRDEQRRCFIAGINALRSGNRLDDALKAADDHGGAFAHDREALVVLLRLARAAHRPDYIDRYAKELAGYAQAQPDADGALRLVAAIQRAHHSAGLRGATYMDGPVVGPPLSMTHGFAPARFTRSRSSGRFQRVAAAMSMVTAPAPSESVIQAATRLDDADTLYQAFLESGDVSSAQRMAMEQVAIHHGSLVWAKRLAQVAEWNQAPALALKSWLAYARSSGDPRGWENVLRLAPMLKDDDAYVVALVHASTAAPGDLALVDAVTAAFERLGRPDDALAFLLDRERAMPSEALELRLGSLAERSGHDDEALGFYREASRRASGNVQYALLTGSVLYRRGDYDGALQALLVARAGAKVEDVGYWRNVGQLALLLRRDDVANDAFRHLLASGRAESEDLSVMTNFYDAFPIDAARTAEQQYWRDGSATALNAAIHYYTETAQYDRTAALLAAPTPERQAELDRMPAYLRVRAEYFRRIGRMSDALRDLLSAVELPGAPVDLQAEFLWAMIDAGSDAQVRMALANWRDDPQPSPELWAPLAAAEMRLNRPEAALRYFRLQAASMSRDPLWQLSYAEAQEMAGHPDLAWSIRRGVWRQTLIDAGKREFDAPARKTASRSVHDQEAREQKRISRVTLSSIFENADVSRAFLANLLVRGADADVDAGARQTLLGNVPGVAPMPASAGAASQLDAHVALAVAQDVAVAWALSHEANPLAKRWLARRYALSLARQSDHALAIALADGDMQAMERLLDARGAQLSRYHRIDALIALGRTSEAEAIAFEGLENAPGDAGMHDRLTQTALARHPSIDASADSFVGQPLDYLEQTIAGNVRIAPDYMVGVSGAQRFQRSTDVTQLFNVPSIDRSVDLFLRRQKGGGDVSALLGWRDALKRFYTLSLAGEWRPTESWSMSMMAGRNQIASESSALMVGGVKDHVVGTLYYQPTPHLYANGTIEAARFYSQSRDYLGRGAVTSGEIGYKFRTDYPDYKIHVDAVHGEYSASGGPIGVIRRIIPAGASASSADLMPRSYSQFGLHFGFGNDLRTQYTHTWRPFMDVGVVHDSNHGWSPDVSAGFAGSIVGGDHAMLFVSHHRVSRLGTPTTQIGARYSWFY
ncbi:tetratricopeptide repeat protein [Burkholderia thailandensis]|uniref:tetratricopeptide repeat protein n=1 Tax=Burkholderia thailandensis TaxID=57975 RepID=UPI0005F0EE8A|nr:tetratricopeptide repeat protein [Burkholderia thailandensis]AOJ58515.1 hypothetical protein AQ477_17930 [Burkholderia thailandensis]KXF59787.1 hypothetical protein AQ476_18390 [Burkholderia thailandensis]